MRRLIGSSIAALTLAVDLAACAGTTAVVSELPAAPPTATAEPRVTPKPVYEEVAVGELLERGFTAYRLERFAAASRDFSQAIATGRLNDAGRALAYWHVAICERALAHEDQSAEALSSFILVGEDVLEMRRDKQFVVSADGDFVKNFRLTERLMEARAFLSAAWALRVPGFGRSAATSIPMHDAYERDRFLGLLGTCDGAPDRQVERQELTDAQGLEQVTVTCESRRVSERYFVQYIR